LQRSANFNSTRLFFARSPNAEPAAALSTRLAGFAVVLILILAYTSVTSGANAVAATVVA